MKSGLDRGRQKMKLRNINGTNGLTCSCGSWLDHWVNFNPGGQAVPTYCPELSCLRRDLVGAHVQRDGGMDGKWYIVPLCQGHNAKADALNVGDFVSLAPANASETCQKSAYGSLAALGGLYPLRR